MLTIRITGLDDLPKKFENSPALLEKAVGNALGKSIAMIETESKRHTPVRTGLLKSSIGGEQGFSYVRGLTAGVGTNVKYAWFVHEGYAKHVIGERKFMEKGLDDSRPFIQKVFGDAMKELAEMLV